ncbi:MAG: EAL domain-containing protein [Otoolea sp.]
MSAAMQKQILIVEDNELNRALLKEILSVEYRILEAENGQEALDLLQQQRDGVALILLDVRMPVMDGYCFLDQMKKDEELSLIPVIVMTQSDSEEDEVEALVHGATDFVPKPYRPQVILHRVASLIKLRETAAMVNQFQYDRLTGLYSKEFFCRKVRERLEENPEKEYTLVSSNLENFKLYNDIFGREKGDRLLKESAENLRAMVAENGICGRYGGDRFLCLIDRERERLARDRFFQETGSETADRVEGVSMKWGIYEITDRSISVAQMCDWALLAADSVKGQYNRLFAVYDDALRGKLLREKAITDAMETALKEGQFTVYLQPKYSLNEESMIGAEALVRWIHPEWGFISPGEFIPLFEKNGFISRLDQYVWEQVCALLQDWRSKNYPPLPVSVNVSRADMYQSRLADVLLQLTRTYGVDPALLHLEITESAYVENSSRIISTVEELRELGFIIEMDDFCSGYSSLNMLSQMKLDILKLDMKFVQNEAAKPLNQSILSDIISMAHRMHLSIVAEGVETREQMKRLQASGCDYVQGYYFAKPMPSAEFEILCKSRAAGPDILLPERPRYEDGMRKLLVADEDEAYRIGVCQTFEGQYRVLEASDADSALSCIRECGPDGIAALILSTTLPENGADVLLKTMRQEPKFWKIPVLATIPDSDSLEEQSLALETDDFLCKRHCLADLRRRIQHLVDIAAFHERESILQEEASRDPLTGLLNRRGLQAAMASLRLEELPLAVCLFDLDDLKKINDTCGHEMGDRIICGFADLLRRQTRTADIQCRYGGDEFLVILKHFHNVETVIKKGSDICRAFRNCFAKEQLSTSCSVGIALCGLDERPSVNLIEHADQALYRAKQDNKGGCCIWDAKTASFTENSIPGVGYE